LNPAAPYRLSPRVGLRPEPFGALAYHFDNRRLVFLKTPELVALVRSLEDHPSVSAAVGALTTDTDRQQTYTTALASLERAEVICGR
jgi:putative mycofactocin binding protein MftB